MAKTQVLSFPVRLPDAMQAGAVRLLATSRAAINGMLTALWPQLASFATGGDGPAWKQVDALVFPRPGHGSRQERCEMEQAGRMLRAQATRQQVFQTILPLLTQGLIQPTNGKHPARKDHRAIRQQVQQVRHALDDPDTFVALTNVIEQACNRYLATGAFPTTYQQLQPIPTLSTGQLPYAGDDGMAAGQTYRIAKQECGPYSDVRTHTEHPAGYVWWVRLRWPEVFGRWQWMEHCCQLLLPEQVQQYLRQGATTKAPTLREQVADDGQRIAVLDVILDVPAQLVPPLEEEHRVVGFDWGVRSLLTISVLQTSDDPALPSQQLSRPIFLNTGGIDGDQARLRREIDHLKSRQEHYQALVTQALAQQDTTSLPAHLPLWQARIRSYARSIEQGWKKYELRNRELAHLASNLLILVALLHDCKLICGENLTTLRAVGRGHDVRGRWRNWRNNSQVRGELWRVLRYKCHLLGIRTRQEAPAATSHTCPHCGKPAQTYRSPALADRAKPVTWGAWLCCAACGGNGSRDYAASLNIARLGMAFLRTYHQTQRYTSYRMTSAEVNPCWYSRPGATLLLPSHGLTPRSREGKYVSYAGWSRTTSLRTSHPLAVLAILSTSALRKRMLQHARTQVA